MGISTYDVDNFNDEVDERIEDWANIANNWPAILTEDGNMVSSEVLDIDSALNRHAGQVKTQVTLLGVIQRQQEQITKLHEDMQVIYDRNRGLEKEVNRIKDIIRKTSVVTNNINHSLFIEGDK
tara:strand:+ start:1530 stop:1901 length:372 start_codon:yes stop_codon:yes gene_type:complete